MPSQPGTGCKTAQQKHADMRNFFSEKRVVTTAEVSVGLLGACSLRALHTD